MRACSSASGGVMFIPDTIERETKKKVSYKDIAAEETPAPRKRFLSFLSRPRKTENSEGLVEAA